MSSDVWCWSRMDRDNEKNVISITNTNVDALFNAFLFEFKFNGTNIMCQNYEKQWTILQHNMMGMIGCATSNFPQLTFLWHDK